jgi:hypothetical protein
LLKQIIPKNILDKGYSLNQIGISGYAWYKDDVVLLLKEISNKGYIILGGDVIILNEDTPVFTGDSWYFETETPSEDDIVVSRDKAINYIQNYSKNNGEDFIYTIVVEKFIYNA